MCIRDRHGPCHLRCGRRQAHVQSNGEEGLRRSEVRGRARPETNLEDRASAANVDIPWEFVFLGCQALGVPFFMRVRQSEDACCPVSASPPSSSENGVVTFRVRSGQTALGCGACRRLLLPNTPLRFRRHHLLRSCRPPRLCGALLGHFLSSSAATQSFAL